MSPRNPAGRLPPHDLEAEKAVLSTLLLDATRRLPVVLGAVRPGDFYSEAHRLILEAIVSLASDERPVDTVEVAGWLRDRERLARIGGAAYLAQIVDATPAVHHVEAHATRIANLARRRRVIDRAHRIAAEGYGDVAETWESDSARALAEIADERGPGGLELLSGRELAAPLPPLAPIVGRFDMVPGAPVLVAGFGFSGKTVAMQSLLLAVAAGRPIWGNVMLGRPGPVVHVDLEQGRRLTCERYQRLARAMDVDLAELGDRVRVACMPDLRLTDSNAKTALLRLAASSAFLLIDSFRAAAPDVDENASDARRVLDLLGTVSDKTGCVVAVIHHARKPSREDTGGARMAIRGSGALYDACGSVLVLGGGQGEPVRIEHVKARSSGTTADPLHLQIEDVAGEDDPRWGLEVRAVGVPPVEEVRARVKLAQRSELDERVLAFVVSHPGANVRSVVANVEGRAEEKLQALERLKTSGSIVETVGASRSRIFHSVIQGGPDA